MSTLGQRLFKARKDKKISQVKLANLCDLNQSLICGYETDRVIPSERIIQMLAKKLEVKPAWLRYGDGDSGDRVENLRKEIDEKLAVLCHLLKISPESLEKKVEKKKPVAK